MSTSLTANQQLILAHAHENTEGKIVWFPESIKGGARQKVIDGLANRGLIISKRNNWFISAAGYEVLGVPRKSPVNKETAESLVKSASTSVSRENSKQAKIIELLKRPEGATIQQLCEATGWQKHTVRGAFAGSLKKKLGLLITSTKESGSERIYRIAT